MSALKPYWGKPAERNFREGDGNNGIIEARSEPSPYSADRTPEVAHRYSDLWYYFGPDKNRNNTPVNRTG